MPTLQRFALPDVGEGLTEADIVTWFIAPGDTVTVNQIIVEIETAKSLVELPCPWDGLVVELLAQVGETVDVGRPIVVVDTDPAGAADDGDAHPAAQLASASAAAAAGEPAPGESAVAAEPAAVAAEPAAQPAASPATEPGTSGGVLVGYGSGHAPTARRTRRRPGASSTDDSSGEVANDPTGQNAARTAEQAMPAPTAQASPAQAGAAGTQASPSSAPRVSLVSTPTTSGNVLAKPPVRKLAKDLGIDLDTVRPSGPGGIVTRDDVIARARQGEPRTLATYPADDSPWLADGVVSADGRVTRVPVRSVRRRTAEAMVASAFTAPHVTVFHTVDVSKTMKLVEALRADREFEGVRVTPLLIAMKALTLAIRRHPQISAAWDEERQEIVYKHYVNLGIAAATPRGLVVPNIKNAHRLGLRELADELAALTRKAREGRTQPSDMADGTVTITNVGVFGIDTGTPILNPGESAILAFGAITQQPWVHHGKVKPRWVTQLALSFDHRLVDGELGARVLSDVARVLEDPARGLVWG